LQLWVLENAERVESFREKSIQNIAEVTQKRKIKWDEKAKVREFEIGEEVLMKKPGLNFKLEECWEGPFTITKKNSPVSYGVDTGVRRLASVHVQLLKKYLRNAENLKVGRATSVMEPDTEKDDILDRFAEVKVKGDSLSKDQEGEIERLIQKYSHTLSKEPGLTHLTEFAIDTGDHRPIFQRAYNTPAALKDSIDHEIDWLLEKGFIRRSESQWASPMVTVKKPNGTAHLCVDFKKINEITVQVPFYMPRVEEVLERVGRAEFISKLDLSKGYYQMAMKEGNICKTAFICHRGRYEFVRMPFWVKNAPAIFQELMQRIFNDESAFCIPYMDEIVVFSHDWESHMQHIECVLKKLGEAGLTANPAKCRWGGKNMEFLGHQVGESRMSLPSHRAEAFATYSKPTTKKGLRAFLGSIGFYRRYVAVQSI